MNNSLVSTIVVSVVAGLLAGAVVHFWAPAPKQTVTQQFVAGSAVGTTFNTAKVAAVNMSLATAAATTSSVYNGDSSDRIILDLFASCSGVGASKTAYTGAGLLALTISAATTSTSAPANVTNSNLVFGASGTTIATSTPDAYSANTTFTAGAFLRRWASGSYLSFFSNATNTAACTVGAHYLAT